MTLYVLVFLVAFFVLFVGGSIYATYRNATGRKARYLLVMAYDKLVHDDTWYFRKENIQIQKQS